MKTWRTESKNNKGISIASLFHEISLDELIIKVNK